MLFFCKNSSHSDIKDLLNATVIRTLSLIVVLMMLFPQPSSATSQSSLYTMDLGHWRGDIASRIYPNCYQQLNLSVATNTSHPISYAGAKLYFTEDRLNHLGDLMDRKSYLFTFDYEKSFI